MLAQVGVKAAEHFGWLVIASVLPVALIALIWLWLPKRVHKALGWLDNLLPGDFSALYRPASIGIDLAVAVVVLVPAAFAVMWSLGVDISATLEFGAGFGEKVGAWAANQGVKLLIVLSFAYLAQRLSSRFIPRAIGGYVKSKSTGEPGW